MARQEGTVIAAGTRISGRLEGAEDVQVFGNVQGTVHLEGALFIDTAARVDAECAVDRLEVHGILVGDVQASDVIELFKTARVVGDLSAPRIIVHEGAKIRGLIDMGDAPDEDEAPRRSAPARRPATPGRAAPPPARKPAPRPAPPRASAPVEAPPAPEPEAKKDAKPKAKAKGTEKGEA
ncbi:MAG: polymer-forming cytoskeletal protein [Myxococcales bacterium]|nr:polymer-forming cytoskeletal protein [Myxococcales bacterium]